MGEKARGRDRRKDVSVLGRNAVFVFVTGKKP